MPLTTEEFSNFGFKGWLGILGTGNRDTAPNNFSWYEEPFGLDYIVKGDLVWTDYLSIPAAATQAEAITAAIANPTLIANHCTVPIRLTPTPNNRVFFACSTYGDFKSRLSGWILPQLLSHLTSAQGYALRFYNGNPEIGGSTEITTTLGKEPGTTHVGWFAHYGSGALIVASDFAHIPDPTNVYMQGFRYIGATASGGSGVVISDHTLIGDGTLALPLSVDANVTNDWVASTFMKQNEVVTDATGALYRATLDFTTDATDIANDILAGNLVAIGGGLGGTFTGVSERDLGGVTTGQVFTGATLQEFAEALLYYDQEPVLVAPSMTFTSSVTGFREVAEVVNINFNATFNRGSITPQYPPTATPYRSGDPNLYDYSGTGLVDAASSSLSNAQTVNGYTVLINGQSWTCSIHYDAGPQPYTSHGNIYDSPLPAGNLSPITRTITGVYPLFATTSDISTLTKQTLVAMNSTYFQVNVVAESGGQKQRVEIPVAWSVITGIQFYNTVSSAWEWIGGSKANSLTTFTVTANTETVQGNVINYNLWTHNGATIGARQLRFYTT